MVTTKIISLLKIRGINVIMKMLEASSLTSSLTVALSDRSKIMEAAANGSNKAETDKMQSFYTVKIE